MNYLKADAIIQTDSSSLAGSPSSVKSELTWWVEDEQWGAKGAGHPRSENWPPLETEAGMVGCPSRLVGVGQGHRFGLLGWPAPARVQGPHGLLLYPKASPAAAFEESRPRAHWVLQAGALLTKH